MKKKSILSFILAVCLIVPAIFLLSACGETKPFANATALTFTDDGEGNFSTGDQTMTMEVGKTYEYKLTITNYSADNYYCISFSNAEGEHFGADSIERNSAITVKMYNSTSDEGTTLVTDDDLNISDNITAIGTYYFTFTSTVAGTQLFDINY